jgi:hypothetical protein
MIVARTGLGVGALEGLLYAVGGRSEAGKLPFRLQKKKILVLLNLCRCMPAKRRMPAKREGLLYAMGGEE